MFDRASGACAASVRLARYPGRAECGEALRLARYAAFPRRSNVVPARAGKEGRGRPMSRRHADVVEVRRRDDVPEQFLWRNRLYQVQEVLGHWVESGAWWRSAPSSAMIDGTEPEADTPRLSSDDLALAPIPASPLSSLEASPRAAQRAWGESAPDVGAAIGPMTVDDGEREFWRVEAGPGRVAQPGVYDLCFDWSANRWQLVQVMD